MRKQLDSKSLNSTGFSPNLSPKDILLGYTPYNNNSNVINHIMLVTKIYVYHTPIRSCDFRIQGVLSKLQKIKTNIN